MDNDNHTIADLAWVAGIFDGEGTIGLPYKGKTSTSLVLMVAVTNTDPRLARRLKELFGGYIHARKEDGRRKPVWAWQISSLMAENFLRAIRPYLLVKAEQADIGLAVRDTQRRGNPMAPRGQYYNPADIVEMQHLRERLHSHRTPHPCRRQPIKIRVGVTE